MTRPLIQKTIVELQEYFVTFKKDKKELLKLADELKHRKVPKAVTLAKLVEQELHKGTIRPLIQKTIVELQEYFVTFKKDKKELLKLADELKHRKVPKAVALAKLVEQEIEGVQEKESEKSKQDESSKTQSEEKIIVCQNCNQKLRINLSSIIGDFSCPKCKIGFRVSIDDGILSIIYLNNSNKENNSEHEKDRCITIQEAYELFEANENTPWEVIEVNRRKLIQQYHPDKVQSLGHKLKVIAEAEGKRINVAFDKLKKHRGL